MGRAEAGAGSEEEALRTLAELHGVSPAHRDGFDREVVPGCETLRAVLGALGVAADDGTRVREALAWRREELARRVLDPVSVAWAGGPLTVAVGPGLPAGRAVEAAIRTEGGETIEARGTVRAGRAAPEWPGGAAGAGHVPLPDGLGPGVHELELRAPAGRAAGDRTAGIHAAGGRPAGIHATTVLVVAPRTAFARDGPAPETDREWGVFLPLHALRRGAGGRSEGEDTGASSLTGLEALLRWAGALGATTVGTLPLLAAYLDGPHDPSPYAPVSRLFWNELYLDPTRLPEWEHAPAARELAASAAFCEEAGRLRAAPDVDHEAAIRLRHALLDELATVWHARGGEADPDFRRFVRKRPEAPRYAAFRGGVARLGPPDGSEWSGAWRGREVPPGFRDETVRRRHLYAQLRFADQLEAVRARGAEAGAGLYLDLPLGTHPLGFDPWDRPDLFARGAALGAPPDGIQPDGQSWGLPPIRPEASARDGHRHFRDVVGTLMAHADHLRIDHVMGLHRTYWVPAGMSARDGAYVRGPAEAHYAILSLESHRHRTVLAGEDLGTVPPEVREAMAATAVRRSYVVPFEVRPDEPDGLAPVPRGAVATLNTHDLPPFAAYWKACGPREREALVRAAFGGAASEAGTEPAPLDVLAGLLVHLGAGPAGLVLASLEDLWLEESPQNRPGVVHPGNWRGRARRSLACVAADPWIGATLAALHQARLRGAMPGPPAGADPPIPVTPDPPPDAAKER